MRRTELILQLSSQDRQFLERYAKLHDTTVSELVARYVKFLQPRKLRKLPRDLMAISGVIPHGVDDEEYYVDMKRKHS